MSPEKFDNRLKAIFRNVYPNVGDFPRNTDRISLSQTLKKMTGAATANLDPRFYDSTSNSFKDVSRVCSDRKTIDQYRMTMFTSGQIALVGQSLLSIFKDRSRLAQITEYINRSPAPSEDELPFIIHKKIAELITVDDIKKMTESDLSLKQASLTWPTEPNAFKSSFLTNYFSREKFVDYVSIFPPMKKLLTNKDFFTSYLNHNFKNSRTPIINSEQFANSIYQDPHLKKTYLQKCKDLNKRLINLVCLKEDAELRNEVISLEQSQTVPNFSLSNWRQKYGRDWPGFQELTAQDYNMYLEANFCERPRKNKKGRVHQIVSPLTGLETSDYMAETLAQNNHYSEGRPGSLYLQFNADLCNFENQTRNHNLNVVARSLMRANPTASSHIYSSNVPEIDQNTYMAARESNPDSPYDRTTTISNKAISKQMMASSSENINNSRSNATPPNNSTTPNTSFNSGYPSFNPSSSIPTSTTANSNISSRPFPVNPNRDQMEQIVRDQIGAEKYSQLGGNQLTDEQLARLFEEIKQLKATGSTTTTEDGSELIQRMQEELAQQNQEISRLKAAMAATSNSASSSHITPTQVTSPATATSEQARPLTSSNTNSASNHLAKNYNSHNTSSSSRTNATNSNSNAFSIPTLRTTSSSYQNLAIDERAEMIRDYIKNMAPERLANIYQAGILRIPLDKGEILTVNLSELNSPEVDLMIRKKLALDSGPNRTLQVNRAPATANPVQQELVRAEKKAEEMKQEIRYQALRQLLIESVD